MSDEQEKPKVLGKFYEPYNSDSEEVIITITMRPVEHEGKQNLAIGVGANDAVVNVLKTEHQFRYAVKHSFLKWLDDIVGVN